MKRPFAAAVWREDHWYVSQCLEVDIASQGQTEEEALANLAEALGRRINKLDKSGNFGYRRMDDQIQAHDTGREPLAEGSEYAQ